MPAEVTHQPIGVLVKPVSADCNLSCTYCFYHDRPTDPYHPTVRHRMEDTVLSAFISQYMSLAGRNPSFSWQGGEPLLAGIDFFRQVIEFQKQYGRSGQYVGNSVQTNGVLIDREWAELFRAYNFLVGVSLDGPEELHDHYQRSFGGHGSFHRVMEGIEVLRDHRVEFNILAVVNDRTAEQPEEMYNFFLSNDLGYLQFIPCVERDPATGQITDFSVKPDQYGAFLCRTFDLWLNDGQPTVFIRFFENILMAYMGLEPEICELKERCGQYVVVEHNGDIYPCDFFVQEPLRLGNLLETPLGEIVGNAPYRQFRAHKEGPFSACQECRWHFICNNGCPRLRYVHQGQFTDHYYLCEGYKRFFDYTHERFIQLRNELRRRQAIEKARTRSEEISRINTAQDAGRRVGRNDPCPCGSGKKYKKCCMGKQ